MNFKDSVAFVTGAGKGLGNQIVRALITEGVTKVYLGFRNMSQIGEILDINPECVVPIKIDITDKRSIELAASVAGDCNLLINNAGVFSHGSLLNTPEQVLRSMMEVNYFGTLNVTRIFRPVLRCNQPSRVINILSISALANVPDAGGYSASKAAAMSLTQSCRHLLRSDGIRVHGVFPGPIDTAMTSNLDIVKANSKEVAKSILENVLHEAEDIFPDSLALQGEKSWRQDPKLLEQQMAMSS